MNQIATGRLHPMQHRATCLWFGLCREAAALADARAAANAALADARAAEAAAFANAHAAEML